MKTRKSLILGLCVICASIVSSITLAGATTITNGGYTFQSLDPAPSGTGFGTYNVILFQNSSGGSGNDGGGVDVDDSDGNLPTGSTAGSGSQFWITSIGDLRAYYDLQFGVNKVTNIVLFLDIDETGGVKELNVDALNIYKNATTTPTALDPTGANDLTQTQQQGTTGQTSGSLLKQLGSSPQNLLQFNTGAGSDDWAIFTGINPYDPSFNATDTLLFNFNISSLENGPEALILSGEISNCDFDPTGCGGTPGGAAVTATGIPEPSTLLLLGAGLLVFASRMRSKTH